MPKQSYQTAFEEEVFFSLRKQRNNWARVAIGALVAVAVSLLGLVLLLPLKEIRPYVVLVDKTTGEAEKVVQLQAVSLAQQDAVLQAELVSYVTDRETYDTYDNAVRITDVFNRSSEQAAETLRQEWTSSSKTYLPDIYKDDRVLVTVKSVAVTPDSDSASSGTATVRIVKQRQVRSNPSADRPYVATIKYKFVPDPSAQLQMVWANPLGFKVTGYRLDAENLGTTLK